MPWELPDGIEDYIGSIKTNFLCSKEGYFAGECSLALVLGFR